MTIKVDRNIYSDTCISNAIYWLSDRFICKRNIQGNKEYISLIPKALNDVTNEEIETAFWERLNDCKLRDIIEKETRDIRTILYVKAFSDYDDLSEEEILS